MNKISDRTTSGWHFSKTILPPEKQDVLIGYSDSGSFCVGHWEMKLETENYCYVDWLSRMPSGLLQVVDSPDIWMAIPNPLVEENLISSNPLHEDSARKTKREDVLAYLAKTVAVASEIISQTEECDRLRLNNEFSVEIKEANDAVEFLRECIDNNFHK